MAGYSWAGSTEPEVVRRIEADRPVYVISDLHLGDGTRSDTFLGKDRELLDLLDRVDREGARLIVAGDAVDFAQAWGFTRVLRAHGRVLAAFSRLAGEGRMVYVHGNHDHDIRLYRDLLRLPVVERVQVGDRFTVIHGHQLDPELGADLAAAEWNTRVHHLVERLLRTWIRIPLDRFYTRANRVVFWTVHKVALLRRLRDGLLERLLGLAEPGRRTRRKLAYWHRSNVGDPACLFEPAMRWLDEASVEGLVCGHAHLPGVVRRPDGRWYANTGSWTFRSTTYLRWTHADGPRVVDHATGRTWEDEHYRPLAEGRLPEDFFAWWRDNYMGWLRFRCGEERRGGIPTWTTP